jgi:effector-associated domain 2 (EAD2)-containing protein/TIR domain-containing protein
MGSVFISYRSVDNPWGAAGIHESLARRFGADRVFRDCVSLDAGTHYPAAIIAALEKAGLLIAVIGPRWLTVADPKTGKRLIDRKSDWVRRELAYAFDRDIPVLPVLLQDNLDDVHQPTCADLPDDIRPLGTIQAFKVNQHRLGADLDLLAERIVHMLPTLAAAPARPRGGVPRIPRETFYSLVEALEAVPCLFSDDTRALLVSQLRPAIAGNVRYSSQRRIHAMNIVRTCLDYEGGVAEMISTIREIEGPESIALQRLAAVARDLPPELRPDE